MRGCPETVWMNQVRPAEGELHASFQEPVSTGARSHCRPRRSARSSSSTGCAGCAPDAPASHSGPGHARPATGASSFGARATNGKNRSARRVSDVRLSEPYRAHQGHPTKQMWHSGAAVSIREFRNVGNVECRLDEAQRRSTCGSQHCQREARTRPSLPVRPGDEAAQID